MAHSPQPPTQRLKTLRHPHRDTAASGPDTHRMTSTASPLAGIHTAPEYTRWPAVQQLVPKDSTTGWDTKQPPSCAEPSTQHGATRESPRPTSVEYSTDSPASHASSRSKTDTANSYGQDIAHGRNHHQRKTHNPTHPPLQRQPATQKRQTAKSARSSATATSAQSTPPV